MPKPITTEAREAQSLVFPLPQPCWWISRIAAPRNASIDVGFADPMYAVSWNDPSGRSLGVLVGGALPIARVCTSGDVAFRRT